jgi:hypothetical protein
VLLKKDFLNLRIVNAKDQNQLDLSKGPTKNTPSSIRGR